MTEDFGRKVVGYIKTPFWTTKAKKLCNPPPPPFDAGEAIAAQ
jgi:hypothetical protein